MATNDQINEASDVRTERLANQALPSSTLVSQSQPAQVERVEVTRIISTGGVSSISGTANQITASASTGAVTLSTPQNLHTGATPTFAGVTFGGTTLSTYTEGSFTLSLKFGGASTGITYTTQVAKYTQVGDLVFIDAYLLLSSKGSATGSATLTGLPAAATSTAGRNQAVHALVYASTYTGMSVGQINAATPSTIELFALNGGTSTALNDTNFSNTSIVNVSAVYKTN